MSLERGRCSSLRCGTRKYTWTWIASFNTDAERRPEWTRAPAEQGEMGRLAASPPHLH